MCLHPVRTRRRLQVPTPRRRRRINNRAPHRVASTIRCPLKRARAALGPAKCCGMPEPDFLAPALFALDESPSRHFQTARPRLAPERKDREADRTGNRAQAKHRRYLGSWQRTFNTPFNTPNRRANLWTFNTPFNTIWYVVATMPPLRFRSLVPPRGQQTRLRRFTPRPRHDSRHALASARRLREEVQAVR